MSTALALVPRDRLLLATREAVAFADDASEWVAGPTLIHYRRCIEPGARERLAERRPRLWTRVRQAAAPLRFTLREGLTLLAAKAHLALELVDHFDARADRIWAESRPHYAAIARRDSAALAARFDRRAGRPLHRVYLLWRGQAVGYFVLGARFVRGVDTSAVLDFLAPPRWLPGLLEAAVLYAHEVNAGLLEVATNDGPAAPILLALGFKAEEVQTLALHRPDPEDPGGAWPPPEAWFITAADVITLEELELR
jgi:hypothetical protein